eukprot:TRINITY_DN18355_c0_g1_i1.p1 TRINITY_DN18355_c0_g1~~TRINITY_DN18355_c0_g1_i1.p1  ORF type:complete len:522 (-),score=127.12 TRINITY_DN18355_c0_g1_i1:56-1621(-)
MHKVSKIGGREGKPLTVPKGVGTEQGQATQARVEDSVPSIGQPRKALDGHRTNQNCWLFNPIVTALRQSYVPKGSTAPSTPQGVQAVLVPDVWEQIGINLLMLGTSIRILVSLSETCKYLNEVIYNNLNGTWEQFYRRDFGSDFQPVDFPKYAKYAEGLFCYNNDLESWDDFLGSLRDPQWKHAGCPLYLVSQFALDTFDQLYRKEKGRWRRKVKDNFLKTIRRRENERGKANQPEAYAEMHYNHYKAWIRLVDTDIEVRRVVQPSIFMDNPMRPYYHYKFYEKTWSKTYRQRYAYMTSVFNKAYQFEEEFGESPYVPTCSFFHRQFVQCAAITPTVCWSWSIAVPFNWRGNGEWLVGRIFDDFFLQETQFGETALVCYEEEDSVVIRRHYLKMMLPHFRDVLLERSLDDGLFEMLLNGMVYDSNTLVMGSSNCYFGMNFSMATGKANLVAWGDGFVGYLQERMKEIKEAFGNSLGWKEEESKEREIKFIERKGHYGNPELPILFEQWKDNWSLESCDEDD